MPWRRSTVALAACLAVALGCGSPPRSRAPAAPATLALVEAAESAERERRYDDARALYERAIAEAPDRRSGAFAARELGSALIFWGQLRAAAEALETAVRLDPEAASAWHDLGVLRARAGDPRAEAALRRAAALRPRDPRPRVALGALLVNQRRYAAAEREYRALLELDLPERLRAAVHRALELLAAERAAQPSSGSSTGSPSQ